MEIFVQTDRLILRELLAIDEHGMFELDSDPEVHKYLGRNPVKKIEDSRKMIEFIRDQYERNGIGRWAVLEKETQTFVGWAGLKFMADSINNHTNFYDLGYRIIRKYWGKGYATEAAKASLQYGFNKLQLKEIFAMTELGNSSSQKVLNKIGMISSETFSLEGNQMLWYKAKSPMA